MSEIKEGDIVMIRLPSGLPEEMYENDLKIITVPKLSGNDDFPLGDSLVHIDWCEKVEDEEQFDVFQECRDYIHKEETTAEKISKVCDSEKAFLLEKNKRYGDSALNPVHVFSKADTEQEILTRLDDKISRIKNSDTLRKNDVVDLSGYLKLLCCLKGWTDFSELID